MRVFSSAVTAYLASGKPVAFWNFLRFSVKDGAGDTVHFDFCDKDADEDIDVINPTNGSTVTRSYLGGGHIVDIEEITYIEGNRASTIQIHLSYLSDEVRDMAFGHLCARQRVEIHEGLIDADTETLVDTPYCTFFGVIDAVDLDKQAADPDSDEPPEEVVVITVAGHMRDFERGNPELRSPQLCAERDGDAIGKYLREAGHWKIDWGRESRSHHDRHGGGRGGKGRKDRPTGFGFGRR